MSKGGCNEKNIAFILPVLMLFLVVATGSLAAERDLPAPEVNCLSYSEYLEYEQSGDKYYGFVPYDDIELLGDFKQYCYSKYDECHSYYLQDGICFKSCSENFYGYNVWLDSTESEDLRFCSQKQGAAGTVVGKCVYVYDFGELEYIKWDSADRSFSINFDDISGQTGKYDFIVSLLDAKTAIVAQEQLFSSMKIIPLVPGVNAKDKVSTTDVDMGSNSSTLTNGSVDKLDLNYSTSSPWCWILIFCGVAVIGGAAVILLRRKKKKAVTAAE